ncbi:MAG: hypothetical protein ACJAS1_003146 [Oleiphilaceae bacterium]|jgi:hypothetical protein
MSNLNNISQLNNGLSQSINAIEVQTQAGFVSTNLALLKMNQDVVGAIIADSQATTFKMEQIAVAESNMLEGLSDRMERLQKSALIAENNLEVERTHGAKNIPANLCRAASALENRANVREVARKIIDRLRKEQTTRRGRSSLERGTLITPALSDQLPDIASVNFEEEEAGLLLEQLPLITGESSFNFSVDNAIENLDGSESKRVMSAWLRSSMATEALGLDVSKRTIPNKDDNAEEVKEGLEVVSIMGEYEREVSKNLSKEAITELGGASEVKMLRMLVTETAWGLKMQYERLEAELASNRMKASTVGYLIDQESLIVQEAINERNVSQ